MYKKILIIIISVIGITYLLSNSVNRPDFSVDSSNHLSYDGRDRPKVESSLLETNSTYTVSKIVYESRGQKIYGLLYMPLRENKVPALVYLPAAGARKEALDSIMREIAVHGYAVLIIDQRGIGETGGSVPNLEVDYNEYSNGKEPVSFMMIHDALSAFDLIGRNSGVDRERIAFMGESMGARTAIIAAAIEKKSKGAIVFSTSGFSSSHPFVSIIDPDNYVSLISPRKFILFHSQSDSVIPFEMANHTYSLAGQPKELVLMPKPCDHGWCNAVAGTYFEKLSFLS